MDWGVRGIRHAVTRVRETFEPWQVEVNHAYAPGEENCGPSVTYSPKVLRRLGSDAMDGTQIQELPGLFADQSVENPVERY